MGEVRQLDVDDLGPGVAQHREGLLEGRPHLVEGLTSHLEMLLNSRQIDLAILFGQVSGKRWSVTPLLEERLFLIGRSDLPGLQRVARRADVALSVLRGVPLVMPGSSHALRELVETSFLARGGQPNVVLEIDSENLRDISEGISPASQEVVATSEAPPSTEI